MAGYRAVQSTAPLAHGPVDPGTLARIATPVPGPTGMSGSAGAPKREMVRTRPIEKSASDAVTSQVGQLSYDAFVRKHVYEPSARAISEQGEEFVRRGLMTRREAATWVTAQRNTLLVSVRDERNTPLGRAYSEYEKPRDQLPDVDALKARQQARNSHAVEDEIYEAIIRSGAKTRASVNRLSLVLRWAGPVLIGADVAFSAYLVYEAPPAERGRVAAREGGGLVGGAVGGWAGAELGCEGGALVGVWFEGVGAVPGCLIGGIAGGLGVGWAGSSAGAAAGEATWDTINTTVSWK